MPTPRLRLGQLLVDARMITPAALDEVLALQRTDGRRLGTLLVERGLINETQLTQILSHQLAVPWVSLLHIEFSRQLLNLVPREVADRFCLVPIYVRHVRNQGDTLYVAMDDPTNEDGLRACREHAGLPVRAMIAPPSDIRSAIRVYYGVATPAPPAPPPPVTMVPQAAPDVGPAEQAATPEPKVEPAAPPAPEAPATAQEAGPERPTEAVEAAPALPAGPPQVAEPSQVEGGEAVPAEASSAPEVDPEGETSAQGEEEETAPAPTLDGPTIEAVEIDVGQAERLKGILEPPPTPSPPPSAPPVDNIPRPRGRAPRMVALTLLDGTTISLPAKRRARDRRAVAAFEAPAEAKPEGEAAGRAATPSSELPMAEDSIHGLTARDLVLALRVVANGADASEVLGNNLRWEALFSALLSLMLKKHIIADWEFIDELKKQL